MNNLNKAIQIAADAHDGQVDKGGHPYILHVLEVMLNMGTEEAMIVGVLHDTIEDTTVTLARLKDLGFSDTILKALDCITRRTGESYDAFIMRVKSNPLARAVKIADLNDNMRAERLPVVTPEDTLRMEKYAAARAILLT